MYEKWQEALKAGMSRSCPNCGHDGRKDDQWVHIACEKCKTDWCYLCGARDIPMSGPNRHYSDWKTKPGRCPQFLNNISGYDDRWPTGYEDAPYKKFLHKLLAYKAIQEFFKTYTKDSYSKMCEVFQNATDHSYDIEEALITDTTLLKIKSS